MNNASCVRILIEDETFVCEMIRFIKQFSYILNPHLVHFYKNNTWDTLPKDWIESFDKTEEKSLIPSLLENPPSWFSSSLKDFCNNCIKFKISRDVSETTKERSLQIPNALLQMKGMNQKKIHEVSLLAGEINNICKELNIQKVVDVGAGSAYLSHLLYMKCNINSIGIEGNPSHTQGALQRFEQLKKSVSIYNSKNPDEIIPEPSIDLVTCRFEFENEEINKKFEVYLFFYLRVNVLTIIKDCILPYCDPINPNVVLIGLHCCGNLTSSMLKIFTKSALVNGIVAVGCCYNHLSIKLDKSSG